MTQYQRRLAAVLMMDVAGYSRLMEADVEGTHARLRGIMRDIVEPSVQAGSGRVVKGTGDGALIELPSISEALRCAMRIQRETSDREASQPIERRLQIRIGINLGDIIIDGDDIYGDGVNIAARLEGLGRPGDVIVSEAAMQTADRTEYSFMDLGVQRLKNISRPVRAFRVIPAEQAATAAPSPGTVANFGARPAIAVLPFRYRGADSAEQEHLADGITEDIISALSSWRAFPVIARGSTFTYKGRDVDPLVVGQQLGARYILEGNLRRQGNRVRSGVHLVDVDTTENLLSEQYQFEMDDIFAVQDEIVRTTVGAMEPELLKRERDRAVLTPVHSSNAYELYLYGMWHHYRYTGEDNLRAQDFFRRALVIAPTYSHAGAALALALVHAARLGWAGEEEEAYFSDAMLHARNAVQADPRDPLAHYALGTTYQNTGSAEDAAERLREAVKLDPSHAAAHANLSLVYCYLNRPEAALPEIDLALRLSPHDPRKFMWLPYVAIGHYLGGHYREALVAAQESLSAKPDYPITLRYLLATLGQLGRTAEAGAIGPLLRRLDGGLEGTKNYMRARFVPAAAAKIVDGLEKSGFR